MAMIMIMAIGGNADSRAWGTPQPLGDSQAGESHITIVDTTHDVTRKKKPNAFLLTGLCTVTDS